MSDLNTAEREKVPLRDFGDPVNRKYPILDQSDVDAAAHLIGRAPAFKQASIKARIIRIARAHGWSIPKAWEN